MQTVAVQIWGRKRSQQTADEQHEAGTGPAPMEQAGNGQTAQVKDSALGITVQVLKPDENTHKICECC